MGSQPLKEFSRYRQGSWESPSGQKPTEVHAVMAPRPSGRPASPPFWGCDPPKQGSSAAQRDAMRMMRRPPRKAADSPCDAGAQSRQADANIWADLGQEEGDGIDRLDRGQVFLRLVVWVFERPVGPLRPGIHARSTLRFSPFPWGLGRNQVRRGPRVRGLSS